MKNIAVLGSCFSRSIAMILNSGNHRFFAQQSHIRLDLFLSYLTDKNSLGASVDVIEELKKQFTAYNKDEAQQKVLFNRINVQTTDKLDNFLERLKASDVLILDNNYDLAREAFEVTASSNDKKYIFSNLNPFQSQKNCRSLGLMPISSMANRYSTLIEQLKLLNPKLKIIFLQYPISGFLYKQGKAHKDRVSRARQIARSLSKLDMVVFPLIHIDPSNLSDKGALYFSEFVYTLYAKAIQKILEGEELPFDPAHEIKLSELDGFCKSNLPARLYNKAAHPYIDMPDRQIWKKAIGVRYPLAIDELYDKKFPILASDSIATCGSCFAQHIGRRLKAAGFNFLDLETAPDTLSKTEWVKNGFSIYSARYGNVYTSRQLLQLIERAFGERSFNEVWEIPVENNKNQARFVDPFRPNLTPDGYVSVEEVLAEQAKHLDAVKKLFTTLDVFIFTMGLTEHWFNKDSGAVYPISPGVTAGKFNPETHGFHNLDYEETMSDMLSFIDKLRAVNSDFRIVLTVSPVPLTATAEKRHVLLSTTQSKSILRAVAGELANRFDYIDYFPAYEIVMSPPFRGMFFQNNMRTIHEQGIDFVMSHFFEQHVPFNGDAPKERDIDNEDFCDEIFLENNCLKSSC